MNLTEAIIKRIKELAALHNLAIPKWSMRAGITPSTMYSILKNTSGCPRLTTIKSLCDVIDLKLSDFFNVDYINDAEYEADK